MAVKRIVTDITGIDLAAADVFYGEVLGLDVLMDQGWIKTFGGVGGAPVQISRAFRL